MLVRAGLCALALVAAAPSGAAAQFTTVVRPPERQAAAVEAASEAARSDSAATLQIVSMQQWVDSVAAEAAAEGDTIVAVESAGDVVMDSAELAARPGESTLRYASGAPAPDTATPLPLLTLVGLIAAGIGGALLYRPRA
ncbi:MAG TPA: hypothetical protein VFZ11_05685 [Gemmatimonadaceae bacterium]